MSWLPNVFGGDVSWTPDGASLLFVTGQRTEDRRVAILDLKPRTPEFREESFWKLFEKSGEAEKKVTPTTELVREGLRERVGLLTLGMDASEPIVSPAGKLLVFVGRLAGQTNLYSYSLERDPKERPTPRQITSSPAAKGSLSWSADSKSVTYLESGRVIVIDLVRPQKQLHFAYHYLNIMMDENRTTGRCLFSSV